MTRILVFSTAYFPHVGGAEVAIAEIASRLGDYEFDLICARYSKLPSFERIGAVNVYRVGVGVRLVDKLLAPFLGAALALILGRKHSYALYWAMMVTYGSLGAYLARFFTKVPVVLTLQEGDPPSYLKRKWLGLVAFSWRVALSQSAAVSVISTYLGALAKEFGYQGEPVIVPNGVDTERFGSVSRTLHEGTVLVTTSRLVPKNAVDDVIRALTYLPDDVSFVIYGTGPDEKKLRALVRTYGLQKRVRFMGHIAYESLPEALSGGDIFVRPSRSEGMGNSFIEAMAAGLPVIATQEGGIADFLYDARRNPDKEPTGWAIDKDTPRQIAEAVRHILANPEEVLRTTENAKRLVKERYDWNLVAGKMRTLFDQTIEKR
jgi:glycosyltransferase involved in cell wall biosynthesis